MAEAEKCPLKFSNVPLLILFDGQSKKQNLKEFISIINNTKTNSVLKDNVTINISETFSQNSTQNEYFDLLMESIETDKLSIINEA